ncbi:dnaJ homolog subfamily B member 1 isoform X2 [Zonotrichia albicollis]|uniref:dnaJ homolog subfamily B member 1 isoform X2 n=1 Tax=Zonotrichia albicollis TaxID=44394 RepID=UPI003D80C848
MFAEFFDGRNPFDTFFVQRNGDDEDGDEGFNTFHVGGFGSVSFPRGRAGEGRKQDPPVLHELRVSLEEIYSGCTKKMKISHKRLGPDGKTVRNEDKILTIEVKKGWKEGTKITFPKEGDQTPNNIPADVVFVLKDKPHDVFRRDGSDIVYPARISLREALCGCTVTVPTLDGRSMPRVFQDVEQPCVPHVPMSLTCPSPVPMSPCPHVPRTCNVPHVPMSLMCPWCVPMSPGSVWLHGDCPHARRPLHAHGVGTAPCPHVPMSPGHVMSPMSPCP